MTSGDWVFGDAEADAPRDYPTTRWWFGVAANPLPSQMTPAELTTTAKARYAAARSAGADLRAAVDSGDPDERRAADAQMFQALSAMDPETTRDKRYVPDDAGGDEEALRKIMMRIPAPASCAISRDGCTATRGAGTARSATRARTPRRAGTSQQERGSDWTLALATSARGAGLAAALPSVAARHRSVGPHAGDHDEGWVRKTAPSRLRSPVRAGERGIRDLCFDAEVGGHGCGSGGIGMRPSTQSPSPAWRHPMWAPITLAWRDSTRSLRPSLLVKSTS